jgi:DNA-binding transcriptional LysR family regulator
MIEMAFSGKAKNAGEASAATRQLQLYLPAMFSCPDPVREWMFASPYRAWAFDLAWPHHGAGLAVEIDGGVFTNGRHNRGVGFSDDCEKFAAAVALGWAVIRIPSHWITDDLRSEGWRKISMSIRSGIWHCYRRSGVEPVHWGNPTYPSSYVQKIPEWIKDYETEKVRTRKLV